MHVPSSQPDPAQERCGRCRTGGGGTESCRCALPSAAAAASRHKGSGRILLALSSTPVPAATLQGAHKKRQDAATRTRTPLKTGLGDTAPCPQPSAVPMCFSLLCRHSALPGSRAQPVPCQ